MKKLSLRKQFDRGYPGTYGRIEYFAKPETYQGKLFERKGA